MEDFKLVGYSLPGFKYSDFIPPSICAAIAGFAGQRLLQFILDAAFRRAFKGLITLIAVKPLQTMG